MHDDAIQEGLNFIPLLSKKPLYRSGGSSHRSTSSRYSTQNVLAPTTCYNGNYEGDSTMFGNNDSNLILNETPDGCDHLIETESETESELSKELERYRYTEIIEYREPNLSPSMRLWSHFIIWLLTEQRLEQLNGFVIQLQANFYYHKLCKVIRLGITAFKFILRHFILVLVYIGGWTYGLWRSKTFLRQASRRLLWSMTLAKCDDASFFGLIILAAPLLFVIASCGFLLSIYCTVKSWLNRSECFIRDRMF